MVCIASWADPLARMGRVRRLDDARRYRGGVPSEQPTSSASAWLPKVSVVVATHNRPQLLRVALAAILTQDYEGEIECILVFDRAEPETDLEQAPTGTPVRSVQVITNTRTPGSRRCPQQRHHDRDRVSSSRSATTTTNGCRAR